MLQAQFLLCFFVFIVKINAFFLCLVYNGKKVTGG
jgi:hypothetical protein